MLIDLAGIVAIISLGVFTYFMATYIMENNVKEKEDN